MNKEIKFRGKTIKEYPYLKKGEVVYGQVLYGDGGEVYIVGKVFDKDDNWLLFDEFFGVCEIIPETLEQYTGVGDKQDFLEDLYWVQHRKGNITELDVITKYKEKFGELPEYQQIQTFKQSFKEWWYENLERIDRL